MLTEAKVLLLANLRAKRFVRNWSLLVVSKLLSQALGMVATFRIARLLSPEGYGQYNLVQTVAALAAIAAGLGLRNVMIRECARHPERTNVVFYASAAARAGAVAIAGVLVAIYGYTNRQELPLDMTALAVGLLIAQTAWDMVESIAFGHQQMEYSAGINFAGSLLWSVAAWGAPGYLLTPLNVTVAYVLLQTGKALAYLAASRGVGYLRRPSYSAECLREGRDVLSQSLPFYWLAILTAVTNQLPILFLAGQSGSAEVGLYNVGWRLVGPIEMIVLSALAALYPGLSQAAVSNNRRFLLAVEQLLFGITLLGTAAAVAISLLRFEIVQLLFGAKYVAAADALAYQCWYSVLLGVLSVIGTTLGSEDKQKTLALLSSCYAAVATPVLWLGASHGATGLSEAMVVAAVLNLPYHWVVFQRSLPGRVPASHGLGLVAIVASGMAAGWLISPQLPLLWRVALVVVLLIPLAGTGARFGARHMLRGAALSES